MISNACLKSGKEAPSLDVEILPIEGGLSSFYVESSEQSERLGTIGQLRRDTYDRNWRVSFQNSPKLKVGMTVAEISNYLQGIQMMSGACVVGGMMKVDPRPFCSGNAKELLADWGVPARTFWDDPSEDYYTFIKKVRELVVKGKKI